LGFAADEAQMVNERLNGLAVTDAILTHAAASAMFSKDGGDHFKKLTKQLTPED
jgi:hypothetical protein